MSKRRKQDEINVSSLSSSSKRGRRTYQSWTWSELETLWRNPSMTTRSFPTPPERDVIFKWPRFYDDPTGMLAKFETEGADPFAKGRESKLAKNHRIQKEAAELMQDAYDAAVADGCADDNGYVTQEDLLERIGTRIDPEGYEVKPNIRSIQRWADSDWCAIEKRKVEVEGSRGRTRMMTMYIDAVKEAESGFLNDPNE